MRVDGQPSGSLHIGKRPARSRSMPDLHATKDRAGVLRRPGRFHMGRKDFGPHHNHPDPVRRMEGHLMEPD